MADSPPQPSPDDPTAVSSRQRSAQDTTVTGKRAPDAATPTTPALQHAATLALKSGRPTRARRIYRTLCMRTPGGPACAQEARLAKEHDLEPLRPPMP